MKLICLLLLVLASVDCDAQTRFKFKAFMYQDIYLDQYGSYIFSSLEKDTSVVIVLDTEEKKITFYANQIVSYDMTKDPVKYKENEFFTFIKYSTVIDKNGVRCNIRLLITKRDKKTDYTIFIDYLDQTKVYYVNKE